MRCDVDGDLASHDLALFPSGDEFTDRFSGAADHRGLRGGHHRHDDVVDSAVSELRKYLLHGKFDGGHRAAASQAQAQSGATADHRTPSSSDNAPATTAAATSPREWPMTAPGTTP